MHNCVFSFIRSSLTLGALSVMACSSSKSNADPKGNAQDAAVVTKASGSDGPSAAPTNSAQPAGLPADADGSLPFSWKVVNATSPRVTVSALAGSETLSLGSLDATADGEDNGKVDACYMKNEAQTSRLHCGGVPAYNFLTANIRDGMLIVTLTRGVDGEPAAEKVIELLRRPTTATRLRATGPASPLLSGNCRRGYVQRTADSPCLKQCLKGVGCKATETCKLIDVSGGDGPHKVSACVPH